LAAFVHWVLLGLSLSVLYISRPGLLDPGHLVGILRGSGQQVFLGYVVLSIVRAFTVIPSTVLVIVGTLLFPGRPVFVMVSSLSGVVVVCLAHLLLLLLLLRASTRGTGSLAGASDERERFLAHRGVVGFFIRTYGCDLLGRRHLADAGRELRVRCGAW